MSAYESIMQGLTEAVAYQRGEILARKTKLTIKPVDIFNHNDIKRIGQRTDLGQVMFAGSLGVSPKTAETSQKELPAAYLRVYIVCPHCGEIHMHGRSERPDYRYEGLP
jgi:DNA-binding transcriptional regulator YiaG